MVAQSSDDAEELNATDPVYLNSTDLELTFDVGRQTNQTIGIRIANLSIPPQATIEDAYIEFTTDEVSEEAASVRVNGEATGNSLTFTSSPAGISQRSQTAAFVEWNNIPSWSSAGGDQHRR